MLSLKCSKCPSITQMKEDSFRRYCQRNNTTVYVCQRCTNQRIANNRQITQEERAQRAIRAKKQWMDKEIRTKMIEGIRKNK